MEEILEESSGNRDVFSPEEVRPDHVIVTWLMHRFLHLPKEALGDLAALTPDLASCGSAEEYRQIAETIREILFPEALIGGVNMGSPTSSQNADLESRSDHVGRRIKELRKKARLTQEQLAERSRLPQSHICRLELGHHSPSHRTLARIAEALNVRVCDLDPSEEE